MTRVAVATTHAGFGAPDARRVVPRDGRIAETPATHPDQDATLERKYEEAAARAARELDYVLSVHPVDSWA